jgi:RNA polymerase sigma-70 factor (sigma-E family)
MTTGGRGAGSPSADELLCRLYQQVTELQAARYAPGYDMAAGLNRYRAWLGEHATEGHSRPEAIGLQLSTALRAGLAEASGGPAVQGTGERIVASQATQGSAASCSGTSGAGPDAARAVTALYRAHYRSLIALAVLLVRDVATAEEVVQDSFVALHAVWRRLGDSEKALSYLRQSVVNRSRSVLRHRVTVTKTPPDLMPDPPAAEQEALALLERSAVISALRALPPRQREAIVLRYYTELSDAQIAAAMGISIGAVRHHAARAISSLREALDIE